MSDSGIGTVPSKHSISIRIPVVISGRALHRNTVTEPVTASMLRMSISSSDNREMHCARSKTSGSSWSSWHDRGYGADYKVYCQTSVCTALSSNVYVAYVCGADYDSDKDLYVEYGARASTSGTFETRLKLYDASDNDCGCEFPAIAASHGNANKIVVAFQGNETSSSSILFASTVNGGAGWSTGYICGRPSTYPALTAEGDGSEDTDIQSDFYCSYFSGNDSKIEFRRADSSDLTTWQAWDNGLISQTTLELTASRTIAVTSVLHEDSQWHPTVLWRRMNPGTKFRTTTKKARPHQIIADPPDLTVTLDIVEYPGGVTVSDWVVGSQHDIFAPSPQNAYIFSNWSDGGSQQHTINAVTGPNSTRIITANFLPPTHTPQPTSTPRPPTRTPTPTPNPRMGETCNTAQDITTELQQAWTDHETYIREVNCSVLDMNHARDPSWFPCGNPRSGNDGVLKFTPDQPWLFTISNCSWNSPWMVMVYDGTCSGTPLYADDGTCDNCANPDYDAFTTGEVPFQQGHIYYVILGTEDNLYTMSKVYFIPGQMPTATPQPSPTSSPPTHDDINADSNTNIHSGSRFTHTVTLRYTDFYRNAKRSRDRRNRKDQRPLIRLANRHLFAFLYPSGGYSTTHQHKRR